MIKRIKIYGINNNPSTLSQIYNAIDNISGIKRILVEVNSDTIYIQSNKEIDDNILLSEIKSLGFEII